MARSSAGPCLSILRVALAGFSSPAAGQGPVLVKDIAPGMAGPRSTYASLPVRFKGWDYFGADDGFLGKELWSTDGTEQGVQLVADLCPGSCWGAPEAFTVSGDFLYFTAANFDWPRGEGDPGKHYFTWQKTLWATDGTAAATGPVPTPIVPCCDLGQIRTASATARIHPAGPRDSKGARQELESSQETRARSGDFAQIGRLVVYAGFDGQQCEPWVSDGTAHGTRRLRHIQTGRSNYPGSFFAAGGLVYFLESATTSINTRSGRPTARFAVPFECGRRARRAS